MGAWSAEIFDDDGAEEIKEEYKILLGYGMSSEEAYQKIEDYFYSDYEGKQDEDVYWLSIALFQWQNGILLEKVKQQALRCIEDENYLERWKDSGEEIYEERKLILEKLKDDLINVVKERKKRFLKCPKCYRYKTTWKVGDLLAYKIISPMLEWGEEVSDEDKRKLQKSQKLIKDKYILLRVVDVDKNPVSEICPELDYSSSAVVMLYDWLGDTIPTEEEICNLDFKPIVSDYWQKTKRIVSSICLEVMNSKEEKQWCEITLLKSEKDYVKPQMYYAHKGAPYRLVSQFDVSLIFTYALTENDQTEWSSDKHFFEV